MEVKIHIPFQKLLALVRQLPPTQKEKLKKELAKENKSNPKKSRLTQLLLDGPVFTEDQVNTIEDTRKSINEWRTES